MGRIRTIKPEFPLSETTGALTREARLLFLQLFTIVDDEGRTRAASRMLASLLYPYDDDAPALMDSWLADLEKNKCVRRYTVEGAQYLEIVNWLKHQKIDHSTKSRLPAYAEGFAHPRASSRVLAPDLGSRTLDQGSGTEDRGSSAAVAGAASALVAGALFEQVFKVHPGAPSRTAKEACRRVFMALLRAGVDADRIVADANASAAEFAQPDGARAHETPTSLMIWLEGYKPAEDSKAAPKSSISEAAYEIAAEIGGILEHNPEFVPPSYCGAPARIQSWLDQGWLREVIVPAVQEMTAKKRGAPPARIEYFERGIADAMARFNAPVPTGNANQPNPNSKEAFREKHSLVSAIDRVFDRLPSGENEDAVLLLPSGPVRGP